jgi:hypothetical protein
LPIWRIPPARAPFQPQPLRRRVAPEFVPAPAWDGPFLPGNARTRPGLALPGRLAVGATVYVATLDGAITPAAAIVKQATKVMVAGVTPSGAVVRSTTKVLTAGVTPTGALVKLATKPLVGGITPSGALIKTGVKILAGGVSPSGALARSATKILAGSLTPSATLVKQVAKILAGGATPSGDLDALKVAVLNVSGSVTPAGALVR